MAREYTPSQEALEMLSRNVTYLAKKSNLTIRLLAEKIGIYHVTLRRVIEGTVAPSEKTLTKLEEYFGCPRDILLNSVIAFQDEGLIEATEKAIDKILSNPKGYTKREILAKLEELQAMYK